MFLRYVGFAVIILVVSLATGCSEKEHPYGEVEGVVTMDGKPLTNVEIVFLPDPEKGNKGRRSSAVPDKDGRYRIASDLGQNGAPVGIHRVLVNDLLKPKKGELPRPVVKLADDEKGGAGGVVGVRVPWGATGVADPNQPKQRFSDDYDDVVKTPLRDIEVQVGSQTINLEVKR